MADIVSVKMPLLSIKDLAVAISTRAGPAEDDPPLYKLGSKPVQAVCRERVELLIELFWEVRENKHLVNLISQLTEAMLAGNWSLKQRSLSHTAKAKLLF